MNEKEILKSALSLYGSTAQTVVAIEELSELQNELCKSHRFEANRQQNAEEIADVQIMLKQMMMLYELHVDVAEWECKKVSRLRERLAQDGMNVRRCDAEN